MRHCGLGNVACRMLLAKVLRAAQLVEVGGRASWRGRPSNNAFIHFSCSAADPNLGERTRVTSDQQRSAAQSVRGTAEAAMVNSFATRTGGPGGGMNAEISTVAVGDVNCMEDSSANSPESGLELSTRGSERSTWISSMMSVTSELM